MIGFRDLFPPGVPRFLLAAAALIAPVAPHESHYVVKFGGHPVGYLRETVVVDDAGRARTTAESRLVLNRLGNRVEMANSLETTEAKDGALLAATAEIRLSEQTTVAKAAFEGGSMRVVTSAGGREYERTSPLAGPVIGPARVRLLSREMLRRAGDRIEFDTFAGEHLAVVRVEREVAAVEPGGLVRVTETIATAPPRTLWLGSDGQVARSRDVSPFGEVEAALASREAALAAVDGEKSGELPEEMYDRTIVRSNVRLPRSRDLDSVTLRVRSVTPGLDLPDFAISNQTVISRAPGEVVVRVDRPRAPSAPVARPVAAVPADRTLLEPNGTLASDDPEVRRVAAEVAGGETDAWRAALRFEKWVHENMTMDLGVVFAPASEVVRNRRGTCMAYSVLLTSLARAAGIPSRTLMGLVYVNGAWGGHAWSEVWAGDRFLPLDGAVYGPAPAGAGRLAFGASTLAAGTTELNAAGQRVFGHVDIDVIAYTVAGRNPVAVADGEPLFRVDGDRWSSPGLGLSLEKPAGFAFEKLDAVWPDDTLVLLRGEDGTIVRLRQAAHEPGDDAAALRRKRADAAAPNGTPSARTIAGREAALSVADGRAALALSDGSDLYVLEAEGAHAARRLDEIAATLAFAAAP